MGTEILVVDDDPIGGMLTHTLLKEAGFTTELISDSHKVIEAIKAERPGLVVLDILMPGIDGLTLCHQIKNDPAIRDTKVIIVSGKSFQAEKERALRYGATLFIEKPYSIDAFAQQVIDVVGPPRTAPRPSSSGNMAPTVEVKIWGARSQDGGALKGPCVSVETSNKLVVLDAGSGIIGLGDELLRSGTHKEIWLLLTHYHPAHVAGLGLFKPTRKNDYHIRISGPSDPDKSLQDAVKEAFESSFAALPDPIAAKIDLYELQEGHYDLVPGLKLSTFYANHPGTTLGFALQTEARRLVYCPDSELYGDAATAMQDYDEKLGNLCHGADLLIQDSRWRDGDYAARRNQGHSSVGNAIDFAVRHDTGQLVLFHQDSSYSDADIAAMDAEAKAALSARGAKLPCHMAREGLTIKI